MPNCSDEFKELIKLMLHYNSKKRLSLEMIKSHPWVTKKNENNTIEIKDKIDKAIHLDNPSREKQYGNIYWGQPFEN